VALFHSWRCRIAPQGDLIWIPSQRSAKAKRFQALAGADAEVVQDCDEAICIKVPNRYLRRALRLIVPEPVIQGVTESLHKDDPPYATPCLSCGATDGLPVSDRYCSVVCRVLGRAGLGWRTNPYRIVDLQTGQILSEGPAFDLTPRGIARLQARAQAFQAHSSVSEIFHDKAA